MDVFCPTGGRDRPDRSSARDPDRYDPAGFDATLFHFGNNPWHSFVYRAFLGHPGIAVLHEVVLHHLIAHVLVEEDEDPERYRRLLVSEYGPLAASLANLKRFGIHPDFEQFLLPLARDVVRTATGVIVHSRHAEELVRSFGASVPVEVIPHHAGEPPRELDGVTKEEARRRLGLPERAFLVGHFGFLTRPKQPDVVIEGFARFLAGNREARLLLVGEDSSRGEVAAMLERHGVADHTERVGYVDLDRFALFLRAVDAVVNLRYPSAGETSGTFARALADGKPVVVHHYGSFTDVPADAVVWVELDGPQAEQVAAHLTRLAGDVGFARDVGERARAYARSALDPERAAERYVAFAGALGRARRSRARAIA